MTTTAQDLQRLREGEFDELFTTRIGTGELIFKNARFVQSAELIPLCDVIAVLNSYESFFCLQHQKPRGQFAVAVEREAVETLLLCSVLIKSPSQDWLESEPDHTLLSVAVKNNLQAHQVAEQILEQLTAQPGFSIEKYQQLLFTSVNVKLTEDLLQLAGPAYPTMFCNDQPLKRLSTKMPEVLPAQALLSFKCSVLSVSSPDQLAYVHITEQADEATQNYLRHLPESVAVTFANDPGFKTDLLIAQLNEDELWLLVSAVCPLFGSSSARKKTSLVAVRILHEKTQTQDSYSERRKLLRQMKPRALPL